MIVSGFDIAVPEPASARAWVRQILGERAAARLRFYPENSGSGEPLPMPRVVDVGFHHIAVRVGDIVTAGTYLATVPGVRLLGSPMTIDAGPLAGFRWQYLRSPWGGYFEIQQWASAELTGSIAGLSTHGSVDPTSSTPTVHGLDHVGLVVSNLEMAVAALQNLGGAYVLGSIGDAGRETMSKQFELDAADRLHMAMVRLGDINLELFQHEVSYINGPLPNQVPPARISPGHAIVRVDAAPTPDILADLGLDIESDPVTAVTSTN